MAFTTPRTWVTGELVTAALLNTYVKDNQVAMYAGAMSIASQAADDVIIASSSTQLGRTANLGVASGGTGASTLTDGGILLGSGTGAITPMSVLANSEMIVGNGATDPVAESGATLRDSIGVGTGDSPQFTAIEVGAASDTTLARASAGNLTVEGNALYRAGGTDVAVADGGTGAGTHTSGNYLKGAGTGAITSATPAATFADVSPLTTRGDILYSSSGTVTGARLGVGDADQILMSDGTDVSWEDAAGGGVTATCRVYNTADQSILGSTSTLVAFNAETYDVGGFHDNTTNNSRLTVPAGEAGYYFVGSRVQWTATGGSLTAGWKSAGIDLYRNGVPFSNLGTENMTDNAFGTCYDIIYGAEGDYFEVKAYQNSGSTMTLQFYNNAVSGYNNWCVFFCHRMS